jgi:hypothetical protein
VGEPERIDTDLFLLFILIYRPILSLCDLFIPNILHRVTDSQQCFRNLNSRAKIRPGKIFLILFHSHFSFSDPTKSGYQQPCRRFRADCNNFLDKNTFSYFSDILGKTLSHFLYWPRSSILGTLGKDKEI